MPKHREATVVVIEIHTIVHQIHKPLIGSAVWVTINLRHSDGAASV